MEGVGDQVFRKAISFIGGMDEAVTEFLSVPANAHVQSLAKAYDAKELAPLPIAAQIMGADPLLMASMAIELEQRGAPRIDINCGCPSNTVTGRGAGSSLLKTPDFLYEIAKAVVSAVSVPVSLKMRSGYENTALFQENLLAAKASGVAFITLHPRTKVEGYTPPARWELIAQAKQILKNTPLVGNGDILTVQDALRMLSNTQCDALMIGRGAVINPFLFEQIKAHFAKKPSSATPQKLEEYLRLFLLLSQQKNLSAKHLINRLKQLFSFLFRATPALLTYKNQVLTSQTKDPSLFLKETLPLLTENKNFFF
jgi:tRNA-dihydrouridine synthase C